MYSQILVICKKTFVGLVMRRIPNWNGNWSNSKSRRHRSRKRYSICRRNINRPQ